ncbi:hypothetical protein BH10BAC2_BH10BAC2_35170 [soil metagenome]
MNIHAPVNQIVFIGTMGGTVSGLCDVLPTSDFLHTALLSALGAAVSFLVSYLLNILLKKRKK